MLNIEHVPSHMLVMSVHIYLFVKRPCWETGRPSAGSSPGLLKEMMDTYGDMSPSVAACGLGPI
jgi:hypothetical protein